MIEIYLSEHCPYCVKVRNAMEEMQIPYVLRPVIVRSETPIALELPANSQARPQLRPRSWWPLSSRGAERRSSSWPK